MLYCPLAAYMLYRKRKTNVRHRLLDESSWRMAVSSCQCPDHLLYYPRGSTAPSSGTLVDSCTRNYGITENDVKRKAVKNVEECHGKIVTSHLIKDCLASAMSCSVCSHWEVATVASNLSRHTGGSKKKAGTFSKTRRIIY